ncbi:LOW QUALITY PROTEIN: all trans-polyprenyl-diphosphate synthase PDSS1-like [Symsagittifera roscoffensis]|uniref:LOW QUALITY PROTEIN: all trans-polyprenyl-diphosphate synthase PDSS1-like n=1 Tax=Symsagittifera roscoffensis TaxID=84072 RepID=UPI00307B5984
MTITSKKISLQPNQLKLAYITEMIHVASLIHDDVVDNSSIRRNCPSLRAYYGESTAVFAGRFVIAQALVEVASLKNIVVTKLLSQVTEDLVSGELMQLGVKKTSEESLTHYLDKSYKKTASLMAQCCKASSILNASDFFERHEVCFQIGKNIGLAFQLADDIVDFVGAASKSDKPTNADLASGLATAPVFFAAFERNDLNFLIMRQFGEKGDVKLARDLTLDSSGVQETEVMIHNHIESAQQLTQKYFGDDPPLSLKQGAILIGE